MDQSFIMNYWKTIKKEAFSSALRTSRLFTAIESFLIVVAIIFLIAAILKLLSIPLLPGNVSPFNLLYGSALSLLAAAAFFLLSYFSYLSEAHPQRVYDKEIEIARLSERLSIKEYDEVDIKVFFPPITIEEKMELLQSQPFQDPKKNHLFISILNNGNVSIINPSISMGDELRIVHPNPLEYPDRFAESEPFGFSLKTASNRGLIYPHGKAIVHIAEKDRFQPYFYFSLHDGISKSARMIYGRWTLMLFISGQANKVDHIEDLIPIPYKLSFDFYADGFDEIEVTKLPREEVNFTA